MASDYEVTHVKSLHAKKIKIKPTKFSHDKKELMGINMNTDEIRYFESINAFRSHVKKNGKFGTDVLTRLSNKNMVRTYDWIIVLKLYYKEADIREYKDIYINKRNESFFTEQLLKEGYKTERFHHNIYILNDDLSIKHIEYRIKLSDFAKKYNMKIGIVKSFLSKFKKRAPDLVKGITYKNPRRNLFFCTEESYKLISKEMDIKVGDRFKANLNATLGSIYTVVRIKHDKIAWHCTGKKIFSKNVDFENIQTWIKEGNLIKLHR